jgi:hypothetical protein
VGELRKFACKTPYWPAEKRCRAMLKLIADAVFPPFLPVPTLH